MFIVLFESRVYTSKGVFEFINTYAFSDLSDKLECIIEVTDLGKVILQEKLEIRYRKSSKIITIPSLEGLTGTSVYVRFIFTQKHETLWSDKGYEICFDQLLLCKEQKIIEPSQTNASINYSEDKKYIYISGQGFEYRFNKSAALFDKLNYNHQALIEKPMEYNAFRAPTDNEWIKAKWNTFSFGNLMTKVYHISVEIAATHILISSKLLSAGIHTTIRFNYNQKPPY